MKYFDLANQSGTYSTTGPEVSLSGGSAETGFQLFSAAGIADGDKCVITIRDTSGNTEIWLATYVAASIKFTQDALIGSVGTMSNGAVTVFSTADAKRLARMSLHQKSETVTTGNVTGVINTHHVCSIAGLTANRNFTVPAGTAGDRIRVTVTDGDDAYELIIIGATGITINGGSAATEWSRLLIAGESVELEATSTTNWQVVDDGRIPCMCSLQSTTSQDVSSQLTWHTLTWSAGDVKLNVGSLADTTNNKIVIRRDNAYLITSGCTYDDLDTSGYVNLRTTYDAAGTPTELFRTGFSAYVNNYAAAMSVVNVLNLTAATHKDLIAQVYGGANTGTINLTSWAPHWLVAQEVL